MMGAMESFTHTFVLVPLGMLSYVFVGKIFAF